MEDNKMQKCRTCLKNSTKILPLTKQARGCNPTTTYGQILQEYAKLEVFITNFNRNSIEITINFYILEL